MEFISQDEPGFEPSEGRSVVYQIAEGVFRPAQIVRLWTTSAPHTANLVVFLDGSNDQAYGGTSDVPLTWVTSRTYGLGVSQYQGRKPRGV